MNALAAVLPPSDILHNVSVSALDLQRLSVGIEGHAPDISYLSFYREGLLKVARKSKAS